MERKLVQDAGITINRISLIKGTPIGKGRWVKRLPNITVMQGAKVPVG